MATQRRAHGSHTGHERRFGHGTCVSSKQLRGRNGVVAAVVGLAMAMALLQACTEPPPSPPLTDVTRPSAACTATGWCWENPLPQGNPLHGVWTTGPAAAAAVGARGTIAEYRLGAWAFHESGTTRDLRGIWGSSRDDMWAVGDGGTILRRQTTGWSAVPSGATEDLRAVWGTGPSDVWAVGHASMVLHWDGRAWVRVAVAGARDGTLLPGGARLGTERRLGRRASARAGNCRKRAGDRPLGRRRLVGSTGRTFRASGGHTGCALGGWARRYLGGRRLPS